MNEILKIRKITTRDKFQELQKIWNELLSKSDNDNIFLTWEWISTWWKHYGNEHKLRVLLAEKEGEIIALAPLMYTKYSILGVKLKKIEFIGTPNSDYNGFILTTQKRECLRLFMNHLIMDSHEWDSLTFREIPENSSSAFLLSQLCKYNPNFVKRTNITCPFIYLPQSYEEFYQNLNKKFKKRIRKRENRLKKLGRIGIKTYNDFASIDEAMKIFFVIHQKRWRAKDQIGIFADPRTRAFNQEIARLFADKGWLILNFLTINNKPISAVYAFKYKQKIYSYQSGFDPEYSKYSVGHLIYLYSFKDFINEGLKEFDWARGLEKYKTYWTRHYRRNIKLIYVKNKFFSKNCPLRNPYVKKVILEHLRNMRNKLPYALKKIFKDKLERLV